MNTLEKFEKDQLESLKTNKTFPKFNPGDTVKVHLKVKEGEKERIQIYEGVCIAKKNAGINSSFTVRKISYGEGIERVLPLYSPQIQKIELVKSGDVIPKVHKVIAPVSKPKGPPTSLKVKWNATKVDLVLENKEDNEIVQLKTIAVFFEKIDVIVCVWLNRFDLSWISVPFCSG